MRIQIEFCADDHGVATPRRVHVDERQIEVLELVDRWFGLDYCYIKVRGHDGSVYILRLDETQAEWELTMFQRAQIASLRA